MILMTRLQRSGTAAAMVVLAALASCGGGGGGGGGGASPNLAPTVPGGVVAQAISDVRIDVSWSAATDADGIANYRVFRDGAEVAVVTTGTRHRDVGLSPQVTYRYAVRACDVQGLCSSESAIASASTMPRMPHVDLAVATATPEVLVGLGTVGNSGAGVAYVGPALVFGPVTLGGLSGPVPVGPTGPLAAFIAVRINGVPAGATTVAESGDVLAATLDLAAYTADLRARTGQGLAFSTLYAPQISLGTVTLTLGSTPAGPGILTCSNPAVPPVVATSPCS